MRLLPLCQMEKPASRLLSYPRWLYMLVLIIITQCFSFDVILEKATIHSRIGSFGECAIPTIAIPIKRFAHPSLERFFVHEHSLSARKEPWVRSNLFIIFFHQWIFGKPEVMEKRGTQAIQRWHLRAIGVQKSC